MHFGMPFLFINVFIVVIISVFPMYLDKDQNIIILIRQQAVVYNKEFTMQMYEMHKSSG